MLEVYLNDPVRKLAVMGATNLDRTGLRFGLFKKSGVAIAARKSLIQLILSVLSQFSSLWVELFPSNELSSTSARARTSCSSRMNSSVNSMITGRSDINQVTASILPTCMGKGNARSGFEKTGPLASSILCLATSSTSSDVLCDKVSASKSRHS